MTRRLEAIAAVVLAATVLAGCSASQSRWGEYPDPIFDTRRETPPPVRPRPTPRPSMSLGKIAGKTVIVDAGHGGKDPGAAGVGPMVEKQVNLAIANRLARLLTTRGAKVVMTRSNDTFISLDGRAATADRRGADLFVSIHADAAQNASASGTSVYIARNASRASRHAAEQIHAAFRKAGIKSRGINRAGFRVLVGHSRPAVLVECGFLTNRGDASKLATAAYQDKVAGAIADGITNHFR